MSPSGIQEQINEIQQSIDDLKYSASGVLAYVGSTTIENYDDTWWKVMRDINQRVTDLNDGIVDASGYLRILDNGIRFHRH